MYSDIVAWVNAKYREFVTKMADVLPDFPNCCYQVSGAVAGIAMDAYGLTDVKVVFGTYEQDGVYFPHGWVRARTRSGKPVILDFAHLQFEPDKLPAGGGSYNQVVLDCINKGIPVPGNVIFSTDDREFTLYEEAWG